MEHCSYAHYAQFVLIHWEEFEHVFEYQQDITRELTLKIGDTRNQFPTFRLTSRTSLISTFFVRSIVLLVCLAVKFPLH